jgi:hypothetical protein
MNADGLAVCVRQPYRVFVIRHSAGESLHISREMRLRKAGLVMNWKILLVIAVGLFGLLPVAQAEDSHGVTRTEVLLYEDWPADAMLDWGTLKCSGGEIQWIDPVTPFCPGSGMLHSRNSVGYACEYAETTGGAPELRLSGVALIEVNGNFDSDYTGPVWGTFMIVPSERCDPEDLIDPEVYWSGTWGGRRSVTCADSLCTWVGRLKQVGKGHGGDIEGLHYKGTGTITTFTPMPIPWELIPGFPVGGPEGISQVIVKE